MTKYPGGDNEGGVNTKIQGGVLDPKTLRMRRLRRVSAASPGLLAL